MAQAKIVQSKLSVKSQTVLPRAVREKLGLKPGDTLTYVFDDNGIHLEKARSAAEDDAFATFTEWASTEDAAAYARL